MLVHFLQIALLLGKDHFLFNCLYLLLSRKLPMQSLPGRNSSNTASGNKNVRNLPGYLDTKSPW